MSFEEQIEEEEISLFITVWLTKDKIFFNHVPKLVYVRILKPDLWREFKNGLNFAEWKKFMLEVREFQISKFGLTD